MESKRQAGKPKVLIVDDHDASSFHLLNALRERWPPSHPPVKIVLLSAEDLHARLQELHALGIAHTMTKPAPGPALRQLATELLGGSPSSTSSHEADAVMRRLFTTEIAQQLPELERIMKPTSGRGPICARGA